MPRLAWAPFLLLLGAGGNLVRNPGFEEGKKHPAHWQKCDDLTSFWEPSGGVKGTRCVRMDTRIHSDDYHRRLEEMKLENPPPAKPRKPVTGNGYAAIGGSDGVPFFSDYIDCRPAMRYRLSVDVRSSSAKHEPKVFVKGYSELPTTIEENGSPKQVLIRRVTFKIYKNCKAGPEWRTSTIEFCPTHAREDVKWLKVMLFPYWPTGEYWFDNVRIEEVGKDEDAPKRWAEAKRKAEEQKRREQEVPVREARATLRVLKEAIDRYQEDLGGYPPSLKALVEDPGDEDWGGPYLLALGEDPWGRPYAYRKTEKGFDLRSLGPDGKPETGDDVTD